MPQALPRLPVELWELIINHVKEKDTLLACSLTCSAFLPTSRRDLFYLVRLGSRHRAKQFLRTICSLPSSTSPYQDIRHLCLGDGVSDGSPWINDALPKLATCLLDVTMLKLGCLKWGLLDDTGRNAVLSGFQKVKHLEMIRSQFDASDQIIQLLASFPSLTHLSCTETHWLRDGVSTVPHIPLPNGLQTIALDSGLSLSLHRLLSLYLHHNVRAIKLNHMFARYTQGVGKLLKALGSRLEELDLGDIHAALGYKDSNADAVFTNDINLAHNNQLRSFSVTVLLDNGAYSGCRMWLSTLLSQIVSPYMEHVLLIFLCSEYTTPDMVGWTQIDRVFTHQRWFKLQKLTISCLGRSGVRVAMVKSIRARLPALESRGILAFNVAKLKFGLLGPSHIFDEDQ